jgi:hypothetical protein
VAGSAPALLAGEGRGPPGHLLGRHILDVLAHHPPLVKRVAQPAAPLAVELILQPVDHFAPAASSDGARRWSQGGTVSVPPGDVNPGRPCGVIRVGPATASGYVLPGWHRGAGVSSGCGGISSSRPGTARQSVVVVFAVAVAGMALLASGSAAAGTGVVAGSLSRHAWGAAEEVPGTAALNQGRDAHLTSVSCGSAGNCSAGGSYQDSSRSSQAFVASQR